MLKKTITYHDLDGNEVTDDFYFNLSRAELTEWQLTHGGGLREYLQSVVDSKNGGLIISTFKEIVSKAYGKRSADGKSFMKSQEALDHFLGTEAFGIMFYNLVTDAAAGAEFIANVLPQDMVQAAMAAEPEYFAPAAGKTPQIVELPTQKELKDYTLPELQALSDEAFKELTKGTHRMHWPQPVLMSAFQRQTSGG